MGFECSVRRRFRSPHPGGGSAGLPGVAERQPRATAAIRERPEPCRHRRGAAGDRGVLRRQRHLRRRDRERTTCDLRSFRPGRSHRRHGRDKYCVESDVEGFSTHSQVRGRPARSVSRARPRRAPSRPAAVDQLRTVTVVMERDTRGRAHSPASPARLRSAIRGLRPLRGRDGPDVLHRDDGRGVHVRGSRTEWRRGSRPLLRPARARSRGRGSRLPSLTQSVTRVRECSISRSCSSGGSPSWITRTSRSSKAADSTYSTTCSSSEGSAPARTRRTAPRRGTVRERAVALQALWGVSSSASAIAT